MNNILILYSSVDGHTHSICQFIADKITVGDTKGSNTTSINVTSLNSENPSSTNPTDDSQQAQTTSKEAIIQENTAHKVQLMRFGDFVEQADVAGQLAQYDTLIIGASIRYGKHREYVRQFVETYKTQLAQLNTAFFSVNLVARKPNKNTADTNSYICKFLAQTQWQPDIADVFAGKLDYASYRLVDKLIIKFIMWLTKGETSSDEPIVYTDWDRVESFAKKVVRL